MFELIYQMLNADNHYGQTKEIDIAKGINKIPTSFKESFKVGYRKGKSKKYKYGNN
jgi:hypothetical protein